MAKEPYKLLIKPRRIEDNEKSPRDWYGGAVGYDISIYISTRHVISSFFSLLAFDGTMNTGLTLRTIRIKVSLCDVPSEIEDGER